MKALLAPTFEPAPNLGNWRMMSSYLPLVSVRSNLVGWFDAIATERGSPDPRALTKISCVPERVAARLRVYAQPVRPLADRNTREQVAVSYRLA